MSSVYSWFMQVTMRSLDVQLLVLHLLLLLLLYPQGQSMTVDHTPSSHINARETHSVAVIYHKILYK